MSLSFVQALDKGGQMSTHELLLTLRQLRKRTDPEVLEDALRKLDVDNDGFFSRSDVERVLNNVQEATNGTSEPAPVFFVTLCCCAG